MAKYLNELKKLMENKIYQRNNIFRFILLLLFHFIMIISLSAQKEVDLSRIKRYNYTIKDRQYSFVFNNDTLYRVFSIYHPQNVMFFAYPLASSNFKLFTDYKLEGFYYNYTTGKRYKSDVIMPYHSMCLNWDVDNSSFSVKFLTYSTLLDDNSLMLEVRPIIKEMFPELYRTEFLIRFSLKNGIYEFSTIVINPMDYHPVFPEVRSHLKLMKSIY
jgi:hypothetical protein